MRATAQPMKARAARGELLRRSYRPRRRGWLDAAASYDGGSGGLPGVLRRGGPRKRRERGILADRELTVFLRRLHCEGPFHPCSLPSSFNPSAFPYFPSSFSRPGPSLQPRSYCFSSRTTPEDRDGRSFRRGWRRGLFEGTSGALLLFPSSAVPHRLVFIGPSSFAILRPALSCFPSCRLSLYNSRLSVVLAARPPPPTPPPRASTLPLRNPLARTCRSCSSSWVSLFSRLLW